MNTPLPQNTPRTIVRPEPVSNAGLGPAPVVVKIGGRALEGDMRSQLARELVPLAGRVVLVHGGGSDVTAWCGRLGIDSRFENGLRVTDDATLEVTVAMLAGLANKRWVALLAANGVRAAGLAALDAGIAQVAPHPDHERLGNVGTVTGVDAGLLRQLLAQGITPVLASIGAHEGRLLNVNADDLAGAIAGAIGASLLVLLSDTPGLEIDGAVVERLDAKGLAAALAHPQVQGGMKPKLLAAQAAIAGGAERVCIAAWNGPGTLAALLSGEGRGTTVRTTFGAAPSNPKSARSLVSHGG